MYGLLWFIRRRSMAAGGSGPSMEAMRDVGELWGAALAGLGETSFGARLINNRALRRGATVTGGGNRRHLSRG